jgi:hypothetical protein
MSQITRSTPYVAPGAPTSPLLLAVASMLVALASLLAARLGFEIPVDPTTAATVAGFLGAAWGFVQNHLARREQARGAAPLVAAVTMTPPAGPEGVAEALGTLREAARGHGVPTAAEGLAEIPSALPRQRETTQPPLDPAVQLHALDPDARPGLDRWSGLALRRILRGEERGVVGPIEWCWSGTDRIRVDIDGVTRMATRGDEESIARALGAELWLEASKNAGEAQARPSPRSEAMFGTGLLDVDGEPVSAGDLDSGEVTGKDWPPADEDPDPDQRGKEGS